MKPWVFTNLAMTMDGKIATKERKHADPSRYDRRMMDVIRARADAVVMGAATLRTFHRPAVVSSRSLRLLRMARKMNPNPINVILATRLDFDPRWPFFTDPSVERVLVLPQKGYSGDLDRFRLSCHLFLYDPAAPMPQQLVAYLAGLKASKVLLEGGGSIMFPWVEQDLIDEWNITIMPKIYGGVDAPTMVEGEGFALEDTKRYRLHRCRRRFGEVFLQYRRKR